MGMLQKILKSEFLSGRETSTAEIEKQTERAHYILKRCSSS